MRSIVSNLFEQKFSICFMQNHVGYVTGMMRYITIEYLVLILTNGVCLKVNDKTIYAKCREISG